jgi:hypothetical protein
MTGSTPKRDEGKSIPKPTPPGIRSLRLLYQRRGDAPTPKKLRRRLRRRLRWDGRGFVIASRAEEAPCPGRCARTRPSPPWASRGYCITNGRGRRRASARARIAVPGEALRALGGLAPRVSLPPWALGGARPPTRIKEGNIVGKFPKALAMRVAGITRSALRRRPDLTRGATPRAAPALNKGSAPNLVARWAFI